MTILEAYGKPLPKSYIEFLSKHPNGVEAALKLEEGRMAWHILGQNELLEVWEMLEVGEAANYRCLSLYIKLASEFFENDWMQSNHGNIPFDRIAEGFVIGTEDGDYLYLDPSDHFSVWIYFHDGAGVLKVAQSFESLIEGKKLWPL